MGLFGKKKEAAPASFTGANYSNMRVEVTSEGGRLLFVALLLNHRGTAAELRMTSKAELPQLTRPLPVHIRGYHEERKKAVYMQGLISPFSDDTWRVDQLTVTKMENDRAFFRLDTYLDATVTSLSGARVGTQPCKLLNLSVGGARLASGQAYAEGERLLLIVRLPEEQELSALTCQVVRSFGKKGGRYEYGCRFLELTEADEGKITQNLFALQRKMRMASK